MKQIKSTHLRLLVPAAALAAATALAGSALDPAIASAREWDIGAYDKCAASNPHTDPDDYMEHFHYCCVQSGGDWDASKGKCVAPPANAPSRVVPGDLPMHTLTPDPVVAPPGDVIQTFTPVP